MPSLANATIQRFLSAKSVAILATIQPSGAPLAMPMWFVHDDQSIVMISEKALQKVKNLHRDPRSCVTVEGEINGSIAGIIAQGHMHFLDTESERAPYIDALHAKYEGALASRWGGRAMPDDRVMFRLAINRINVWGLD